VLAEHTYNIHLGGCSCGAKPRRGQMWMDHRAHVAAAIAARLAEAGDPKCEHGIGLTDLCMFADHIANADDEAERGGEVGALAEGERIWVAGEPVWIHYDPDLTVEGEPRLGCADTEPTGFNSVEVKPHGALQEVTHFQAGLRRVIRLRRWDERVFLHEVLHILLGKHYPPGTFAYDHTFIPDPKHEAAVTEIEDGLWDMGWRYADGQTFVDLDAPNRIAAQQPPDPLAEGVLSTDAEVRAFTLGWEAARRGGDSK
jgi:hypothetical protein